MKYVVIVNGKPESGKTTFTRHCIKYLDKCELAYGLEKSSIDYIKEIYRQLGWDGKKTDKARKELSLLKKMWSDNNDGPIKNIVQYVLDLNRNNDHVIFVDVREESEIEKFVEVFDALRYLDIKCITLFIDRPDNNGIEYGNKSDDNVGQNMSLYDYIIQNDSDIENLFSLAEDFINDITMKGDSE